jgi:hypothetical protein
VLAEDLASALDAALKWHEVQRPDLSLAYSTAIGIAGVQLTRLRQTLDEARHRALDRTALDGLLHSARVTAERIGDVRRVGGPGGPTCQ